MMKRMVADNDGWTGCVSGPKNTVVQLQDALKKPWPDMSSSPPPGESVAEPLTATA